MIHTSTIKINLEEHDQRDGVLERLADIAYDHGISNWQTSSLHYILTDSDPVVLRERVVACRKAFDDFFRVTGIKPVTSMTDVN